MKRSAVINDISGFGKCSLTMALPILSACGIECCPVPTAVLSTHTGEFTGYTYRDLTDDMPAYIGHWASLDLCFSSIYSGYLGSVRQIEIVSDFIERFRQEDTFVLVDPCMADDGRLYSGMSPRMTEDIHTLCRQADLIVPNMTEAEFMLGLEHRGGIVDEDYGRMLARRLAATGIKRAAVTGLPLDDDRMGVFLLDSSDGGELSVITERQQGIFYGTGDLFACITLSAIENDMGIRSSVELGAKMTAKVVKKSAEAGIIPRNGLLFESCIPELIRAFGK